MHREREIDAAGWRAREREQLGKQSKRGKCVLARVGRPGVQKRSRSLGGASRAGHYRLTRGASAGGTPYFCSAPPTLALDARRCRRRASHATAPDGPRRGPCAVSRAPQPPPLDRARDTDPGGAPRADATAPGHDPPGPRGPPTNPRGPRAPAGSATRHPVRCSAARRRFECSVLLAGRGASMWVVVWGLVWGLLAPGLQANPDAKRLYDDLLSNYNRLIRPVGNNSDRLTVKMGLRLSQLIDVNLKNQIMTTNVWVEQEWHDYKLKWNPEDYGGVETLHVPSEHIWLPDIVLYNNADGNYEVTIMTKAILNHTGKVTWKPPAIYKSFCEIDVEYFPFDEQTCFMKFGSWTYDGYLVDLRHMAQTPGSDTIDMGIDLQDYYLSVEWDIMRVPAVRNEKFYSCCEEPYPDIIFNITLRRKTLFYTVNLIIPCVGISFLSVLVFYLPSDSGEKVSLCISILLSLTVFFLLLAEIIPPTSLTVPLLGKYLLFTMVLVTLSVVVTIAVLNVNFRSPVTHKMAPWVHRLFIRTLPKVLFIERPQQDDEAEAVVTASTPASENTCLDDSKFEFQKQRYSPAEYDIAGGLRYEGVPFEAAGLPPLPSPLMLPASPNEDDVCRDDLSPSIEGCLAHEIEKAITDARFIAQHVKNKDKFENVEEDWKYVAMVLDRLFLWIFSVACVMGTALIILQAPSLYDTTRPIDIQYSKIAKKKLMLMMMGPEEE